MPQPDRTEIDAALLELQAAHKDVLAGAPGASERLEAATAGHVSALRAHNRALGQAILEGSAPLRAVPRLVERAKPQRQEKPTA